MANYSGGPGPDNYTGTDDDDQINGRGGNDVLRGEGGDDLIYGRDGNDTLDGGAGDDRLFGEFGDDILNGGDGNDSINGAGGYDVLSGGAGDDVIIFSGLIGGALSGGTGVDRLLFWADIDYGYPTFDGASGSATFTGFATADGQLNGTSGNDVLDLSTLTATGSLTIFGGDGNDVITGGRTNDTILGQAGDDFIDGGAGSDTASYAGAAFGVTVNLAETTAQDTGGAGLDQLVRIEHLVGSAGSDNLTGNAGANRLEGDAGHDVLIGDAGADILIGGAGGDQLIAHLGDYYGDPDRSVDRLDGGADDDLLILGYNDIGDGGEGWDRFALDLSGATRGANLDFRLLLAGEAMPVGVTGSLQNVETFWSVYGTDYDDTIIIGDMPRLDWDGRVGGEGGVFGGSGDDRILGGKFVDWLIGDAGHDHLKGMDGNDWLDGNDGEDLLDGGTGNDAMDGGRGNDLYIVDSVGDVITEYADQGIDVVRSSVSMTLGANVEELYLVGTQEIDGFGNRAANTIVGNAAVNTLAGLVGNDRLIGGAGDDHLRGGFGFDVLTGGADADRFVFGRGDGGATERLADRITDFSSAEGDIIDLRGTDAIAGGADDAFTFIGGAAFSGAAGELRYAVAAGNDWGMLMADTNGDGAADLYFTRLDGVLSLEAASLRL